MSGSFESLKSVQFVGEGFYALFLDGLNGLYRNTLNVFVWLGGLEKTIILTRLLDGWDD